MTSAQISSLVKWIIAGGIVLVLFITGQQCQRQGWLKPVHDTVTIKHDTTLYRDTGKIVYVPVPYQHWHFDSLHIPGEPIPTDTVAILADYNLSRMYHDSVYKSQYGYVIVEDTIFKNRIIGRSVIKNITVPTITNTITLTQPKRVVAYIGLEGFGLPVGGAGSFGLKMRNDNYYGLKAYVFKSKVLYGAEIKLPIKLR